MMLSQAGVDFDTAVRFIAEYHEPPHVAVLQGLIPAAVLPLEVSGMAAQFVSARDVGLGDLSIAECNRLKREAQQRNFHSAALEAVELKIVTADDDGDMDADGDLASDDRSPGNNRSDAAGGDFLRRATNTSGDDDGDDGAAVAANTPSTPHNHDVGEAADRTVTTVASSGGAAADALDPPTPPLPAHSTDSPGARMERSFSEPF